MISLLKKKQCISHVDLMSTISPQDAGVACAAWLTESWPSRQYGQDHCKVGGPRDGIIPES